MLVRSGTFQRGYVPGESGYISEYAKSPTTLGAPVISIKPVRILRGGEDYIDWELGGIV
jgi:hypothetical protein